METLGLLGVLDVEKIVDDYFVHLCDASVGVKEDLLVCMISKWIFGGTTTLVGSDS
jgi:hypothetical protein